MIRSLFSSILLLAATLAAHADFRFIHMSDTHFGATIEPAGRSEFNARLFREISGLDPKPAFAVNTGDVVEVGTPAEYKVYNTVLPNLTLPLYNAPGNHDVRWNPLGKEGYTKGVNQPLNQSWDHQNIHFVTLDSTVLLQHWGHISQEQLDWLAEDLKKVGRERPVVIGFHHWIGRESVQVDNERKLLEVVAPYNVILWLMGHGHSDITWSVDGVPAIMVKGLYQGSYNIIDVTKDQMRIQRRILGKPDQLLGKESGDGASAHRLEEVMVVSLKPQAKPRWSATVRQEGDLLHIIAQPGQLPSEATLEYRIDTAKAQPMETERVTWRAQAETKELIPGEHVVTVLAKVPDGRVYQSVLPVIIQRENAPKPAWEVDLRGAVQSRLVRQGEALYVTTMRGDVFALDPASGRQKWKVSTDGPVFSTPAVVKETVYIGSGDHHVYAIDAASGEVKWKTKTGGGVFASAAVAGAAHGDIVCIASVDQKIYGLDAGSGKVLWTVQGNGMYQSQAATDGQRFFVGGWDNMLRCIDAQSGKQVWERKFGRSFYFAPAISSPAVAEGIVYVTSNDGVFHAVKAEDGADVWEFDGKKVGYSSPLVHEGVVYIAIGDQGQVFAFDAKTGEKRWESSAPSGIYDSSFAQSSGRVFIGTVSGILCAFDAKAGKPVWRYALGPGHLLASPAADERRVYISSMSGKVTALAVENR